jgi:hypothetical protein
VIISARVSDVRSAQQLGSLIVIPFVIVYVLGEIGAFPLTVLYLLILSAIIRRYRTLLSGRVHVPTGRDTHEMEEAPGETLAGNDDSGIRRRQRAVPDLSVQALLNALSTSN